MPVYKYCPLVPQLLYRVNQIDAVIKLTAKENLPQNLEESWTKLISTILMRVLNKYPRQNLWWLASLLLRDMRPDPDNSSSDRLKRTARPSSQCEFGRFRHLT